MSEDRFALGWKLQQAGDLAQAEAIYRSILATEPRNARVWFVLGTLHQARKEPAPAADCFRQALQIQPEEIEGHFYLGNALLEEGKHDAAATAYRACLRYRPDHAEALTNLGFVLNELGQLDEARSCYQQAARLKPGYAEVHQNLGNVLREQGQLEAAITCYQRALEIKPTYAKAHVNLGIALVAKGAIEEAVHHIQEGMSLQPDFAEGHNSLGAALSTQGKLDEAIAEYEQAIALKPDYAEAHWNLALAWLLQGNWEQGWPAYEWRWRCKRTTPLPNFSRPRWDGSVLAGKTILLLEEQGLGDTLHFIRFANLLHARGATVLFQCRQSLHPLLRRCSGISRLVATGDPVPPFDVHAPLLSLPYLLNTRPDTVPATGPYLNADPSLIEHWHRELAPMRGFRVGIAWQGNPNHPWDRHRSIPLAEFEPLARVPGVCLISLQKGPGSEQIARNTDRFPLVSLGSQVDETAGAFMDTAAIMQNLDLVVAADSAVAHLAGALGVPVWVALSFTPDWRWFLDRHDSPWYPTMRLFRQSKLGGWNEVFAHMAKELERLAAQAPRRPLLVEVAAGELIDKLTILEIKENRIRDPAKLRNVQAERRVLQSTYDQTVPPSAEIERLRTELKATNLALWEVEDALRECEQAKDFGPRFIELARSVYRHNDHRARVKAQINDLLGSRLREEKSYGGSKAADSGTFDSERRV